jgi:hypothetical protein
VRQSALDSYKIIYNRQAGPWFRLLLNSSNAADLAGCDEHGIKDVEALLCRSRVPRRKLPEAPLTSERNQRILTREISASTEKLCVHPYRCS